MESDSGYQRSKLLRESRSEKNKYSFNKNQGFISIPIFYNLF